MSGDILIRIDIGDGTAKTLWTDAIDLPALGTASVTRASHVEFDAAEQAWFVAEPDGRRVKGGFSKRAEALAWEHEWANGNLMASA